MKPSMNLPLFGILAILAGWALMRYQTGENPDQGGATPMTKVARERPLRDPERVTDISRAIVTPVDWAAFHQGNGKMDDFARFEEALPTMSLDELAAQLDGIAALGIPAEARKLPESLLLHELIRKDPEFALKRYIHLAQREDSAYGQILPMAMKLWARKDPAQAVVWFDAQIAKGMFPLDTPEGPALERQRFESVIVGVLLSTDPEYAAGRLDAILERSRVPLPGEGMNMRSERLNYLCNAAAALDNAGYEAYAELVRTHLDAREQVDVIATPVSGLVGPHDLSKVTEYVDRIQATPAERASCASAVVGMRLYMIAPNRRVTLDDLNEIVSWASVNAPDAVGTVTGQFLGHLSIQQGQMTFAEAASKAVALHGASRNDDILVAFLKSSDPHNDANETLARDIANRIGDNARRIATLEGLK